MAIVEHDDFVDIPPTRSSTLYVINFSTTPHADPDLLLTKHVVVLYLASQDKNASTRAVKTTISSNNAVLYECLDLQIMTNDEQLVSAAGYDGIATLTANVTTQTRGWQSEKLITGYPEPGEWRWKRIPIPPQHGAGSITSADIRALRADDVMSTDSTYASYDQNGNLLYPRIKPEGHNIPVTQTLQGRRLSIAQNVYQIVEQSSIDDEPVT